MDWTIFWSAVGSIGTALAGFAAIWAVLATRKQNAKPTDRVDKPPSAPLPSVRTIKLTGQYDGPQEDTWDIDVQLQVDAPCVQGQVRWRLAKCPRSSMAEKIGKVALEDVEGTFEPGRLELRGNKVDKPNLKGTGEYTIKINAHGTKFQGKFRAQKPWQHIEGDVRGDASIKP